MFSPFVVSCADCHAKLKIKNERFLGKRLKCPKCGEAILVERAADSTDVGDQASAVANAAATRQDDDEWDDDPNDASSELDDFTDDAYEEEDELDGYEDSEYEGGEFEDEFGDEEYEETRRRPTERRKARGRAKSLASSSRGSRGAKGKKTGAKKAGAKNGGKRGKSSTASPRPWMLPAIIGGGVTFVGLIVVLFVFVLGGDDEDNVAEEDGQNQSTGTGSTGSGQSASGAGAGPFVPEEVAQQEIKPPPASSNAGPKHLGTIEVVRDEDAALPEAAKNIVLVRAENDPYFAAVAFHYLKRGAEAVVVMPLPYALRGNKLPAQRFQVEFDPGTPNSNRQPARLLGAFGLSVFLSVQVDRPAPVPMNGTEADSDAATQVQVVGFEHDETQQPAVLRLKHLDSKWSRGQYSDAVPESFIDGALICAPTGLPVALAGGINRRATNPARTRSVSNMDKVHETALVRTNGSIQANPVSDEFKQHGVESQQKSYLATVKLDDPTQSIANAELFVGTLKRLRADLKTFDAERFDEPVTTDMRPVPLQWTKYAGNQVGQRVLRGILLAKDNLLKERRLVFQARFTLADGSSYFEPARVTMTGSRLGSDNLSDGFLKGMRDPRDDTAAPVFLDAVYKPVPEAKETAVGAKTFEAGGLQTQYLNLQSFSNQDYSQRILPEIRWSEDAKFFYLSTSLGRLHRIRVDDQTETASLNLIGATADLETSAVGVLSLTGSQVVVIDPESLEVTQRFPAARVRHIASVWKGRRAVGIRDNELITINLQDGTIQPAEFAAGNSPSAWAVLLAVSMEADGEHVIVADMSRVSRFKMDAGGKLQFVASTESMDGLSRFTHEPHSRRFSAGVLGRNASIPGFPAGNEFVFSVDDLKIPQAGFTSLGAESGVAFHPLSGALIAGTRRGSPTWFKSDGAFFNSLSPIRSVLRGSASPDGRWMLLQHSVIALVELNESFRKQDAFRITHKTPEPVVLDQSIVGTSVEEKGWKATSLTLALDPTFVATQTFGVTNSVVQAMAWSESGDVAFLLLADGTLSKVVMDGLKLERQIALRPCRNLLRTSEGLVLDSSTRNELFLVDEDSLEIRNRIPLGATPQLAGSPGSSLVWMSVGKDMAFGDFSPMPFSYVVPYDLKSRTFGAPLSMTQVNFMLNKLETEQKVRLGNVPMLAVSPDGRYLFMADARSVARFGIQGNALSLQDAIPLKGGGSNRRLYISADSSLFAVVGGRQKSRDSHPVNTDSERGYGAYVFAVNDFNRVVIDAPTSAMGDALVVNTQTRQAYSRTVRYPLTVIAADGSIQEEVQLGTALNRGFFAMSPRNNGYFVCGENTHWVQKQPAEN